MNMTEWDKMQEHQIYNDFDADLFDLRVKAKKLFKEFNRTEDEETERRQDIMRRLFKKIGDDSVIGAGSVVSHDIPSGVLAAGNPCRVIREITDKDKVGFIV